MAQPMRTAAPSTRAVPVVARRKLAYKEARELEQLPGRIEGLENTITALTAEMAEATFYQRDGQAITAHTIAVANAQAALDAAFARWSELDSQ